MVENKLVVEVDVVERRVVRSKSYDLPLFLKKTEFNNGVEEYLYVNESHEYIHVSISDIKEVTIDKGYVSGVEDSLEIHTFSKSSTRTEFEYQLGRAVMLLGPQVTQYELSMEE